MKMNNVAAAGATAGAAVSGVTGGATAGVTPNRGGDSTSGDLDKNGGDGGDSPGAGGGAAGGAAGVSDSSVASGVSLSGEDRVPLKTILTNFLNEVDSMRDEDYEREFKCLKDFSESLKSLPEYCTTQGEKDWNRKKNRYKDILPFDSTRVVLSSFPGVPGSDYINANYIKGASGSNAYIASQGPLPATLNDFWRMIVETEVQVIVMACNEQEAGKYKCERYWTHNDEASSDNENNRNNENMERQFGNYYVKLSKCRDICPDFLVRTLRLRWKNNDGVEEERTVCQFHYSAWPDHGIPARVKPLLEMVRLIRDCQASETLPVLIHCSAGCGRTGTICAIDFIWGLLRTGKLGGNFSLYDLVQDMRRQRIAIVQTVDQYILVHRAVKELFLEQLRVIDSHPYENVDGDGRPLLNNPDEIIPDYETVFVQEKSASLAASSDIDTILSEKISQKAFISSSSQYSPIHSNSTEMIDDNQVEDKPTPPPKKRDLESLNLESRISIGTSASAAASTVNSSDNLLEDFHRDISKSTPKLFDPPESSSPGRIKKGNLRLCQTDDGLWKLDDNSCDKKTATKSLVPTMMKKKSSVEENNESSSSSSKTPSLIRRRSLKKFKAAFFNKSPPNSTDGEVASAISKLPTFELASGSRSVPSSLDRKSVRKSLDNDTPPLPHYNSQQPSNTSKSSSSIPSPTMKPSLPIKRSKSMKVINHSSSLDVTSPPPPPKPKRLLTSNSISVPTGPDYANINYSSNSPVPELNVQFQALNVDSRKSLDEDTRKVLKDCQDYIMASFESAEKEGDKILKTKTGSGGRRSNSSTSESSPSDSYSKYVVNPPLQMQKSNFSFSPPLDKTSPVDQQQQQQQQPPPLSNLPPFAAARSRERRNSFRQAVDKPPYEPMWTPSQDMIPSTVHQYEPINFKDGSSSMAPPPPTPPTSTQQQSSHPLTSVGLVNEVLKTKQIIRKHNSSSSLLSKPMGGGSGGPPPPYKSPPSISSSSPGTKRSSSVSRIHHRHLPSLHDSSRVTPIYFPSAAASSNNSQQLPPELPKKENSRIYANVPRRHSRDSVYNDSNLRTPNTSISYDDLASSCNNKHVQSQHPSSSTLHQSSLNNNNKSSSSNNNNKKTNRLSLGDFSSSHSFSSLGTSITLPGLSSKAAVVTPPPRSSTGAITTTGSPPGIDLDTVAAMMQHHGGAARDMAKPLFGRSLVGVLSGAASNLRSRLLGGGGSGGGTSNGSPQQTSSSSSSNFGHVSSSSDFIPSSNHHHNHHHHGTCLEGSEMNSSSIPLTVPGATNRHVSSYNYPQRQDICPMGPKDQSQSYLRKQEYL